MQTFFKKIQRWYQSLRMYVIIDPFDNSVTLSKKLFAHIRSYADMGDKASVFMFRVEDSFGFMLNPNIDTATQFCDIQYNEKYKCIGFETLNPSVGRILYDFGLSATQAYKLSVTIRTVNGKIFYQLDKPCKKND